MTKELKEKINKLPHHPGVYFFKNSNEEIVYIGKAIDLIKRIKSHFSKSKKLDVRLAQPVAYFYDQVADIDYIETPSEKDALILERKLVRQYQPRFNVDLRDDKDFLYIAFTNEARPKVIATHQTKKYDARFIGPIIDAKEAKDLLTGLRRLFPYRTCNNAVDKPCLYYHLGLCFAHNKEANKYDLVVKGLETIMRLYNGEKMNIECYDISNTNGSMSVGSMVAFKGNKPNKKLYRKFKIRTVEGANDPSSLKEIVTRRLSHKEWGIPDLIVIDGGRSQLSMFKDIDIPVVGLAKLKRLGFRNSRRSKFDGYLYSQFSSKPFRLSKLPIDLKNTLLAIRDEAHRFAITFHRKTRMGKII